MDVDCKTILIVEDDQDASFLIDRALRSRGYQSQIANHGEEALKLLRSGIKPCIVFLDLMMPVMSGQEFRKHQLNDPLLADIPTVVVSASDNISEETKEMRIGEYLKKPIDFDRMLQHIERHC